MTPRDHSSPPPRESRTGAHSGGLRKDRRSRSPPDGRRSSGRGDEGAGRRRPSRSPPRHRRHSPPSGSRHHPRPSREDERLHRRRHSPEQPTHPPRGKFVRPMEAQEAPSEAHRAEGQPDVVYRDREGKVISREEWLAKETDKFGKRRPRREEPQELEWGGGLIQRESKAAMEADAAAIAAAPFARYEISEEADRELKKRQHWGDPMANFSDLPQNGIRSLSPPPEDDMGEPDGPTESQNASPQRAASSNGDSEGPAKNVKSAEIYKPPKREVAKPVCKFSAPPNRFDIPAGYRWDGVVRGIDFERKLLDARAQKELNKEIAYKWSVEEM